MEQAIDKAVEFKKLLTSSVPEVANLAIKAMEYKKLFDTHQITESELDELLDDIKRAETVDKYMDRLDIWKDVKQAIDILIYVKTLASFI